MAATELSCAETALGAALQSTIGPCDAIAAAAELIKSKSFTIDGEAVVLAPDGLSRFEELFRREAVRTAILYAFDLAPLRPRLDRA
jgi:ATP-dependent DNA ligase